MKKGVLFSLFLVFLVACAGTTDKKEAQPTDFRFGTQALQMEFVPNMPPTKIYSTEGLLNVMLKFENKGTSVFEQGSIHLSGFDKSILPFSQKGATQNMPVMEPRSAFLPQGGISTLDFQSSIIMPLNLDKYNPTLLATACYLYSTEATAQVCIDSNPYAPTNTQKVCIPSAVSLGSQGAPVAVTSVEVVPAPMKTRFTIHIQNVGGGTIFKQSSLAACSPYTTGLKFEDVDYVTVESVTLSTNTALSCMPTMSGGILRLTNGQASLFCEASVTDQDVYLAPLYVKLKYGYRQSISLPIEIKRSG